MPVTIFYRLRCHYDYPFVVGVCSYILGISPCRLSTLFVALVVVALLEPDRKQRRIESPVERAKMLAAFEDRWAARKRSSPRPGLSLLVTPLVPPSAVLAPAPLAAVTVVGVTAPSAAPSSRLDASSRLAGSSCFSAHERSRSHHPLHGSRQSRPQLAMGPGPSPVIL